MYIKPIRHKNLIHFSVPSEYSIVMWDIFQSKNFKFKFNNYVVFTVLCLKFKNMFNLTKEQLSQLKVFKTLFYLWKKW
jgi:hypothetical protein